MPGSWVSGLGQCRVAAVSVSGLLELAYFFSTISHCAWRRVISWSLATKKRSKENAFKPRYPKCPQRAVPIHRCPKARCSPEPRMFEPLLLANPDIDTLRHQCSRASTICPGTSTASRVSAAAFLGGLAAWSARLFSGVGPYSFARRGSPMGWRRGCAERTNLVVGCSRIARDVPWAGSITGGEACQNPCTEKEGFKHRWLWRAPCFWGTYE